MNDLFADTVRAGPQIAGLIARLGGHEKCFTV
jgi:hypothetical protein